MTHSSFAQRHDKFVKPNYYRKHERKREVQRPVKRVTVNRTSEEWAEIVREAKS